PRVELNLGILVPPPRPAPVEGLSVWPRSLLNFKVPRTEPNPLGTGKIGATRAHSDWPRSAMQPGGLCQRAAHGCPARTGEGYGQGAQGRAPRVLPRPEAARRR